MSKKSGPALYILYCLEVLIHLIVIVIFKDVKMSEKVSYEMLKCLQATYFVPQNSDFKYVRHKDAADKSWFLVRCVEYVSLF